MAATLVGVMWWDRPMDETMPRPPALAREQDATRAPLASTSPTAAPPAAAPPAAVPEQTVAADAKLAEPAPAPARRSVEPLAKEHGPKAAESVPKAAAKNEAPTPFPSMEKQRAAPVERKSLGSAATDAAKKDANADRSTASDVLQQRAPEAPSAEPVAPPPLAGGRLRADERRTAATADSDAAKAKSAGPGAVSPAPAPAPVLTRPAPPARDNAAAAPLDDRPQRQRAGSESRDKEAAGFASSPAAPSATPAMPFRQESERGRSETAAAEVGGLKPPVAAMQAAPQTVAPARILAAIAVEPQRWSRQTTTGDTVPLDAGWRAWLAELDAAAAGRWRPLAAGVAAGVAANDNATTVRLVAAGRVVAVVRVDGATAEIDASPGSGSDRWQATLAPAPADRLRSTARRLLP